MLCIAASGYYWVGLVTDSGSQIYRGCFSPDGVSWYLSNYFANNQGVDSVLPVMFGTPTQIGQSWLLGTNDASISPYRFSLQGGLPNRLIT
jgi:hypothetical protein